MDSKYFLNIEKISTITYNKEKESDFKWVDEKTTKSWFGLSIKKTEAGWNYKKDPRILSSESLKNKQEYKVDEINKKIYNRTSIDIYIEDRIVSEWFDTDTDALKWINELIFKSGKPFQVLENE